MANSSTEHSIVGTTLISNLLKTIEDEDELKNSLVVSNPHVQTTFSESIQGILNSEKYIRKTSLLEIESALDYIEDEINSGHWSQVPVNIRKTYTTGCFIKTILNLKYSSPNIEYNILKDAIKTLDRGLLLGAPLEKNKKLLTKSATIISENISEICETGHEVETDYGKNKSFPMFQNIKAKDIESLMLPSIESFNKLHFSKQLPVKLKGCINHWPAMSKWKDISYLLKIAAERTVPVELGSQYIDENWSQRLMTLKEFIENYYLNKNTSSIGYLAQHNLFDQIPELRSDIYVPEYCSLSQNYDSSCDPDINCWFGPAGTISSLHFDPKNNLLAQVFGTKQILLFAPEDSLFLHPHDERLLNNTSQIDPLIPDLKMYPDFIEATMYKCLLKEGEVLFIPEKWWHHVIALEKSFSVSFWWQ